MIGITRSSEVVTLELRRHDKRNALDVDMCTRLRDAVEQAVVDDARVIVITGEGSSFCAGADLSGGAYAAQFPDALLAMLRSIDSAPVPVMAAVNGPAIGAGCQLALACDLRVVDDYGRFAIPVAKLGLAVDNWTVRRLVCLAGGGPARSVLLGAESIGAERAFEVGLANRIGDHEAAQQWAQTIAALAPLTLRHLKLVLNDDGTLAPANDLQQAAFAAAWSSQDKLEARAARAEKRMPRFEGR